MVYILLAAILIIIILWFILSLPMFILWLEEDVQKWIKRLFK